MLEDAKYLFPALNMKSNSFSALTGKIGLSCIELEINLIFSRNHVLFRTYNFGNDCKKAKSPRKELNLRAHRCYVYKLAMYT